MLKAKIQRKNTLVNCIRAPPSRYTNYFNGLMTIVFTLTILLFASERNV